MNHRQEFHPSRYIGPKVEPRTDAPSGDEVIALMLAEKARLKASKPVTREGEHGADAMDGGR